jgi:Rad/Gem-related GTP binding protein 1
VARTYDCKFIETSTVLNHNVDELLVGILRQIRLRAANQSKHSDSKSPDPDHQGGAIDHIHHSKGRALLDKLFGKKDGVTSASCDNLFVL